MKKKKIIIVGGGISGLTAGIYALKAGFEADIYEKHRIVGGECTGWDREGYHIDNCIHWMMGTTSGTALNKIWKDVGAVGDGVEIIQSDKMYISELDGERITLWKDIERTKQELLALSPQDETEINRLMEYAKMAEHVEIPAEKPTEMWNAIDLIKMGIAMKNALKLFKVFEGTDTNDLMDRFKHPLIKCMISDFCTKESLGYSFPMAYGNFTGGDGGIPRGGSREMAFRIQKKFESLGGKVYINADVTKILLANGGNATGIRLADGKEINADYIICACDTDYTFGHLLDRSYIDPILSEMYANRKAYPVYGMFQVAFAVDCDADAIVGDVMLDCRDIQFADWVSNRMSVKNYAYEPGFAPEGKQIVQVLLGLREEAFDYWMELYKNKPEYLSKKEEIANMLQKIIEERFTDYQGKMRILDIWTPVTYHRYCNAYKGYNQSFTITKYSAKNRNPSATIKGIDNVVLAGQWLSPPGGLPGAAIQGKYAIQRILKKEKRSIKI
jgi:phytoene dehydrogenase-like protein